MTKEKKKRTSKAKDSLKVDKELNKGLYEEERLPEVRKIQFVNFLLGKEWYGVEISKLKDVMKVGEVTYLPCAPNYIAGIVNLRGNILSITDLKKIFGLQPSLPTKESRILVLYAGEFETGIIVDRVSNVVDVELDNIDPPLETLAPETAEYIIGECKLGDLFFAIVNVEKIFAFKEKEKSG